MLYQQAEKEHSGRYAKDGGDHRYRIEEGPFFFGFQDGVTYLAYGGMGREQLFKTSGENFTKHSDYSSLKKSNSFCYIDLKKLLTTALPLIYSRCSSARRPRPSTSSSP